MTAIPSRAPTYLQPRLKAVATSNLSSQSAGATNSPPSRPTTPASRVSSRQYTIDPLSEKATSALIRRTLCPQTADKAAPISDLLPPLTSSNDVDLQLYALIAIIIKEFVQTWYSKITPDQVFVEEVVQIIAHCSRGLEQRLRKVDLEALVFDELPELLDTHVRIYRTAYYPVHPPPLDVDPRVIYHSLWPTPALEPIPNEREPSSGLIQKENEAEYRQLLVQSVLAILLPTEDLENDCLTTLVGQIFSEMIIGNGLSGKACEPWLLWEAFTKIAELVQTHLPKSRAQQRVDMSNACEEVNTSSETKLAVRGRMSRWAWSPRKTFWTILQYTFLAFTTMRFMVLTIASSSSLPSRSSSHIQASGKTPVKQPPQPPSLKEDDIFASSGHRDLPVKGPILSMSIWPCISNLLDLNLRMPWLCATLSLLQWCTLRGPGGIGCTDGMIDKLLSHAIATHILNANLIPVVLRSARAALFPGNSPAPPRTVPGPEEQLRIRRHCAETILGLIPKGLQEVYFGVDEEQRVGEVEEVLDVFGDSYANKHLVYGLVELILVRLMPELAEQGVSELLEERLS